MNVAGTILITRIACYVPSLQNLDLPSNRWVNFSVDLHEVICIKEFNPEDEESMGLEKRCAVVYTVNNNFLVDEDYEDLLRMWVAVKNGEGSYFPN
jgi:hypothetical protein